MREEQVISNYSHNEVIDVIPKAWKKAKLRYITNVLTDYTANGSFKSLADNVKYLDQGYARLIRLTDLRKNLNVDQPIYVSEEAYKFLKKSSLYGEEFLIASVGAYAGYISPMPKISFPATLGPNMMLAKFDQSKVNNKFMYYAASSVYIQEQLKLKANSSSAQPKLNKEDFRSVIFVYPELKTQVKIAKFLDQKTSEIDALISDKEKLIKLLEEKRQAIITEAVTKGLDPNVKMKDSGVEWIGEIPEHWSKTKLKYCGKAIIGLTYSPKDVVSHLEGNLVLRSNNIQNGKIFTADIDKNVYVSRKIPEKLRIKTGDILICTRNGSKHLIGKSGYAELEHEGFSFGAFTTVYRSDQNKFIYYLFMSNLFHSQIGTYLTSTINQLTITNLNNLYIVLPPESEQELIVNYLNNHVEHSDFVIDNIKLQISKLKEYRQSLIYEAVTGKIDVQEILKETEQEEVSSS